jgi:hypothetical protein
VENPVLMGFFIYINDEVVHIVLHRRRVKEIKRRIRLFKKRNASKSADIAEAR